MLTISTGYHPGYLTHAVATGREKPHGDDPPAVPPPPDGGADRSPDNSTEPVVSLA